MKLLAALALTNTKLSLPWLKYGINKRMMSNKNSIQTLKKPSKTGICISCGKSCNNSRRRYCSRECRQQMLWVLSLSRGLLSIFNARYASFSFNSAQVILDILPVWSKDISRFIRERMPGKKPAEDLKYLILQSGSDWHEMIQKNNSRSYASLCLLKKYSDKKLSTDALKPDGKLRPRFSKKEKESIKLLDLEANDLVLGGHISRIKSAYKKMAKVHHPDMGGDSEKFKRLNEAHQQMLIWAENPQFTSKKALIDCWSFDSYTNKWTPPL
jgi:hypothetical protein